MTAVPVTLPPGLYEAAARLGQISFGRSFTGQLSGESRGGIPQQFTGGSNSVAQSPVGGSTFGALPQSAQLTGSGWAIDERERSTYYHFFSKLDVQNRGQITGEQAVLFFSDSKLPEEVLASIWDLADVNSDGQLNRDEFAVAMYLIRQQRVKGAPPLPTTLPQNLIPPSMRNQPRAQTASPSIDSSAYSSQAGKSAADDLFGLDTISSTGAIQKHSTGGTFSQNKSPSDPFSNNSSIATSPTSSQTLQPPSRARQSSFRPFTPSSSFGQNLTGQVGGSTSLSSLNQSRGGGVALASEDLLGDNDPEVSKQLTSETTELANMSNQISTLRTQMEEVQSKKGSTENNLSNANTQKQELEAHLSHFRTLYEQEAKAVKTLEERLAISRNATRKLQQELAMIEGTHQDLQNQHHQVAAALQMDERENTSLKEQIRQVNSEINQLRPQIEKMRSEARQQKGLVAINKKQLATNVGERDKLRSELESASADAQELPQKSQNMSEDSESGRASPAVPLTRENTNPFFRKSGQSGTNSAASPSGLSRTTSGVQATNSFDNIFGSPFPQQTTGAPPPTSFRADSNHPPSSMPSGQSVQSSEPDVTTPSATPPLSSYHGSPRVVDPPAPPVSRQITSSALPLRSQVARNESFTSSVKVSTPSSRYESADAETPTGATPATFSEQNPERSETNFSDAGQVSKQKERRLSDSTDSTEYDDAEKPSMQSSLPGAFPATPMEPNVTRSSTLSSKGKGGMLQAEDKSTSGSYLAEASVGQNRGTTTPKSDFDAAFAGFDNQAKGQQQTSGSGNNSTNTPVASKLNNEFPPIQDLAHDEESDSDSERGFDDDFTPVSSKPQSSTLGQSQEAGSRSLSGGAGNSLGDDLGPKLEVEQMDAAPGTPLPSANAQASPPSYQQTVTSETDGYENKSHFPREYSGLLPSRDDPTDHPQEAQSLDRQSSATLNSGSQGEALFGTQNTGKLPSQGRPAPLAISTGPSGTPISTGTSEAYDSAVSHPSSTDKPSSVPGGQASQMPPTSQPSQAGDKVPSPDDFDAGFEDLAEAKEVGDEDKGDDDFVLGSSGIGSRDRFDEFDPVFESSSLASKPSTSASQQTTLGRAGQVGGGTTVRSASGKDSFSDFEYLSRDFNGGASSNNNSNFGEGLGGQFPQLDQGQGQGQSQMQSSTSTTHDWDAMFSGLGAPGADNTAQGVSTGTVGSSTDAIDFGVGNSDTFASATFPPSAQSSSQQQQQFPETTSSSAAATAAPPSLNRTISMGTEHDDPILKKLTSMGYPRADALAALERFDYDINKVSSLVSECIHACISASRTELFFYLCSSAPVLVGKWLIYDWY